MYMLCIRTVFYCFFLQEKKTRDKTLQDKLFMFFYRISTCETQWLPQERSEQVDTIPFLFFLKNELCSFFNLAQKAIVCMLNKRNNLNLKLKGRKKDISILEKFDMKEPFWFLD
jgi:hypothetical protein